ncbi:MAG: ATP-binding cassette domain-containing protein [Sulfurovaceae bacterium]|nr:ATP-binding cassette domain-containing protein [Sulfurovaceae bacterium]MDD5548485.1 ATP-binding cassette domain-containing protein [Sulfurovaceae bacterium]
MQLYNDEKKLAKDIYWLTHECSLPLISKGRVSRYAYAEFEKKFLQNPNLDNENVLSVYTELLKLYGLKKIECTKGVNEENLPCVTVVPNEGLCIVLEKTASGTWRCDSAEGTRYYPYFEKGTQFLPIREERGWKAASTAYEMFKKVALREKEHIFHAAIATLSINILALGTSFFSMQVYDRVIPTHGISTLVALTVGVGIAIMLEMILKVARSVILDDASTAMDRSYSHNIFDRFLKIRSDALPNSIGTLSGQLQGYANVRSFITTAALYFVIDLPFTLFFLLIVIMLGGLAMGIIPMIFFFASLSAALFFKNKIETLTELSVAANNKKLGLLVECVENAETLKAHGASFGVQNKWNSLTEDAINDDIAIRHYSELSMYIAALLQQFSYIGIVAWGAYRVTTTDQLTMGGLIAISILSSRVLTPLAALPNIFVQWGRSKISIKDLDNIFALPQDNEGIDKPLAPDFIDPRYSCQNVKFAYKDSRQTLNIPGLNIRHGERVGILGVIGTGKSTMLKLLSGLYAPTEGHILLGGIDIQHISRHKVSSMIGYLPQATKLVSGTIRDNLTLGLVGVNDSQIMAAAQITGLTALINSAPNGLDTVIPEGGNTLSGGQKQLISITRIILENPLIWLLDEPTANMDDFTEKNVINALNSQITADKTLILVTHKPALLALVNRLVVLTPQGVAMDGPKNLVLEKLSNNRKNSNPPQNTVQNKG